MRNGSSLPMLPKPPAWRLHGLLPARSPTGRVLTALFTVATWSAPGRSQATGPAEDGGAEALLDTPTADVQGGAPAAQLTTDPIVADQQNNGYFALSPAARAKLVDGVSGLAFATDANEVIRRLGAPYSRAATGDERQPRQHRRREFEYCITKLRENRGTLKDQRIELWFDWQSRLE